MQRKKMKKKSERKEKIKNKKIYLNSINYFHILFQTHFTYYCLLCKD